ncbi:BQ2448_7793 [Microbotryum intermedium]|uniref:BQ2448_7793 protein n=1 Tax=Microbotryum intermedium TaxID=269621 RepID=A0A238FSD2_9BASI|nr:BQ2448_7793 [Microbotryum intermedium]
MVSITLTPHKGNSARFYPHSGYLGLAPIVIEGTVKTMIEEDRKPIKASSVVVRVRCYETELVPTRRKGFKKTHVLYERECEVWTAAASRAPSSSSDQVGAWAPLGDFSSPFKVVIPSDNSGVSTCTFKNYRVWWQIEGGESIPGLAVDQIVGFAVPLMLTFGAFPNASLVINHKPMAMLGASRTISYQIPLLRYPSPMSSPLPPVTWDSTTSLGATPGLDFTIRCPTASVLQSDEIAFFLFFHSNDARLQVKKVQFSLDRHMTVDCTMPSATGSDSDEMQLPPDASDVVLADEPGRPPLRGISSVFRRGSSFGRRSSAASISPLPSPTYSSQTMDASSYFAIASVADTVTPMLSPPPKGKNSVLTNLMTIDFDNPSFDEEHRVAAQTPGSASLYRYSIGETMRTNIAQIAFTISAKIFVRGRTGASEVIELAPRVVRFAGCSASALDQALQHITESSTQSKPPDRPARPSFNAQQLATPPLEGSATLGARRSQNFRLTVDTTRPTSSGKSLSRSDDGDQLATRLRSGQYDMLHRGPIKSAKANFAAPPTPDSPSFEDLSTPTPAKETQFMASLASRPQARLQQPPLPHPLSQPRHGFFPLATRPAHLSSLDPIITSTPTASIACPTSPGNRHQSRKSARSPAPYSATNRPRSAGQLSSRSTTASLSSASSSRFSREQSAPPLSTSSCQLLSPDALPSLSLYPRKDARDLIADEMMDQDNSSDELRAPSLSRSSSTMSDIEDTMTTSAPMVDFKSFSLVPTQVDHLHAYSLDTETRKVIAPWTTDVSPLEKRGAAIPQQTGMTRSSSNSGRTTGIATLVDPGRRKSSSGFGLFGRTSEDGDDKESSGRWSFLRRGSKI